MSEDIVENPLSSADWLALDEAEKISRVLGSHEATRSPTGQNADAHATIHVNVEDRLAREEPSVVRAFERMRAAGLKRHTAIHALASVVARHMMAVLEGESGGQIGTIDQAQADRDFDALDPADFKPKPRI